MVGLVVVGIGTSAAAAPQPEFAAVTTGCSYPPDQTSGGMPTIDVTLYNLPAQPTVTATTSVQGVSAPLILLTPFQSSAGPWVTTNADTPPQSSWGQPVTVSVTWTVASGSGGTHTQLIGLSTCSSFDFVGQTTAILADQSADGYWIVASNGRVVADGSGVSNYGDLQHVPLNAPVIGIAAQADGAGYWLLGSDGGVFSFGLANFYGSTGSLRLNAPIVGMAATRDGNGYWLVAKDGGVFAYGDAQFYGSMGGRLLNQPIVGMAVDQATGGYWLVAADGGIFSFNAPFHGSTGGLVLNQPIVGMQVAPDGSGYRLAARDGGVFSFNMPYAGSNAGNDNFPVVSIAGTGNTGYWLLDSCGDVFSFGSAQFHGSGTTCQT